MPSYPFYYFVNLSRYACELWRSGWICTSGVFRRLGNTLPPTTEEGIFSWHIMNCACKSSVTNCDYKSSKFKYIFPQSRRIWTKRIHIILYYPSSSLKGFFLMRWIMSENAYVGIVFCISEFFGFLFTFAGLFGQSG